MHSVTVVRLITAVLEAFYCSVSEYSSGSKSSVSTAEPSPSTGGAVDDSYVLMACLLMTAQDDAVREIMFSVSVSPTEHSLDWYKERPLTEVRPDNCEAGCSFFMVG